MSEKDLIQRVQKKDKAAIKEIYVRYAPVMLGICLRYCGNREDAKDVMHESFIKIITNISKYTGKGSFEGWMKRIMVNASIDFYKKKRKNEHIELETDRFDIETVNDGYEFEDGTIDKKDVVMQPSADLVRKADFTKEEIISCLLEIPEKYRIIFNLFVLENYSHAEIADMLGVDEKVSRTRLFRAKEMIKKVLHTKSIERIAK